MSMDPQAICHLLQGEAAAWTGLERLDSRSLPSCIGPEIDRRTVRFRTSLMAVAVHRAACGRGDVKLYRAITGGPVELVEVWLSPPADVSQLTAALGAPAGIHHYSVEERAAVNLPVPGDGSVEELIYPDRGLALTIGRNAAGRAWISRIRGFAPMPVEEYLHEYVALLPQPL
jgi:hypothetical protein